MKENKLTPIQDTLREGAGFIRTVKKFCAVISILVALLAVLTSAHAADWYVKPNGTGSWGTDWNCATTLYGIPWGCVNPGDTIWLAGGNYGDIDWLSIQASGSAGNNINIKRVLCTDATPTAAAGWSSSFDAQVIVDPTNNIPCYWGESGGVGSYVYIDGRVDSGISFQLPNVSSNDYSYPGAVYFGEYVDGTTFVTFTNVEMAGPASAGATNYVGNSYLCALSFRGGPYGGDRTYVTNVTVSHCRLHGAFDLVLLIGVERGLFDHCQMYDCPFDTGTASNHPNMTEWGFSTNITYRYCQWSNWYSEGIKMGDGATDVSGPLYLYGNLFVPNAGTNVARVVEPRYNTQTVYFYNNTSVNFAPNGGVISGSDDGTFSCDSRWRNNIYWNSTVGTFDGMNIGYEFTDASSILGAGHDGPSNIIVNGSNPFVDLTGGDYHLTSTAGAVNTGVALTSPPCKTYEIDPDDNIRGADGAWDIGAYEYENAFTLVDVQMRGSGVTQKTGTETVGYGPDDIWNVLGAAGADSIICVDYLGNPTSVNVSTGGNGGGYTGYAGADPLFMGYAGDPGGGAWNITLTLPTGGYDIYLYGVYVVPGGREPTQYATFQVVSGLVGVTDYSGYVGSSLGGLQVDGATPLVIEVNPDEYSELGLANGLQIVGY